MAKMSNKEFVKQTLMEKKAPITNRGKSSSTPPERANPKKYQAQMDVEVANRIKSNAQPNRPSIQQDVKETYRRDYNKAAKTNNFVGAGSALAKIDAVGRIGKKKK